MKYLKFWCELIFFSCFSIGLHAQEMLYVIDGSFNTGTFYTHGAVADLLLHDDVRVLVSGGFGSISQASNSSVIDPFGNILYNGITSTGIGSPKNFHYRQRHLRCGVSIISLTHIYGGTDHTFKFEFQKSAYNGFLSNDVLDAIVEPDDNILAAGRFFTDSMNISPETIRQLCRVDSTGAPDPDFPMLHCAEPMDAKIHDIEMLSDGSYILSGQFYEFGGYDYNHVGKLNPDFTVDTTFINSLDEGDTAILSYIDSQDRIWVTLFSIDIITGENAPPITNVRLVRLLPTGQVDTSFLFPNFLNLAVPGEISGINDMVEMPDGRFILVGDFDGINGYERKKIALIEDDGTVVEGVFEEFGPDEATWGTWSQLPNLSTIRLLNDGKLLLGGKFSSFGGEPYSCLVRLQPQPLSTREIVKKETLRIYPNPAIDRFSVKAPGNHAAFKHIVIYDLAGRKVFSKAHRYAELPIEILDVTPGMYVVNALTSEGIYSGRLIVE